MKPFDPTTDSWARGDPIPMTSNAPLAAAEAALAKGGPSDLYRGPQTGPSAGDPVAGFQIGGGAGYAPVTPIAPGSFDYIGAGAFAGGSNPEGIGTSLEPNKSNAYNYNPSVGSVSNALTGMANGPGGASNTGGSWEMWLQDWFIRGTLIVLGFIFIAAGLSMFGKGDVAQQVLRRV